MKKVFGLEILTLVFVLAWATNVLAANIFCGDEELSTPIEGDVIVDSGLCTLNGADVMGNVKVERGGWLIVRGNTIISGDVKCRGCNSVAILSGTVGGDVRIIGATGPNPSGHDDLHNPWGGNIVIYGDVRYIKNSARMFARGAVIHGDLQVSKNDNVSTDPVGPIIEGNTIDGDLQCNKNDPAPFSPDGNDVGGDMKGQCAGF